jgi:GNAT superfamily N-acetyltransferase
MGIVQLTLQDYESIVDLWRRAELPIKQTILGWRHGGELVGTVIVTHDSRKGWINHLAVDPAYRHQGIGRHLIEAAEELLSRQGIMVVAALIFKENRASMAVLSRAGYTQDPSILYLSRRASKDA